MTDEPEVAKQGDESSESNPPPGPEQTQPASQPISAPETQTESGPPVGAIPDADVASSAAIPSGTSSDQPGPEAVPVVDSAEQSASASPDASESPASASAPTPSEPVVVQTEAPVAEDSETPPVPPVSPTEPAGNTTAVQTTEDPSSPSSTPPESTPPQQASPAVTSDTEPETAPTDASTPPEETAERASARLRDRMGTKVAEKAVGSEDILTQRPDIPAPDEVVDIPGSDELDASLEAEISSALGEQMAVAPPAPSIPTAAVGEAPNDAATGASQPAPQSEEIGPGSKVTGAVQHIHGDDVFINAGIRSDVVISLKQFPEGKPPAVGDSLTVIIDSANTDGLFRARLPQARTKTGGNWDGLAVGQVVDCTVTGTNKGGLQVTVSNLKAFLPASQVDLGYVSNLEQYVGQKLTVQITEVKPKKRNLVVSRRALLQAEREAQQDSFWQTLEVGQDYPGTVKTMKNYGAFVNLGPIDGFLHIGEISWSRINHPNEVLKENQEVQVRILKIDKEKGRISLGMKQLVQNPWLGLSDRYPSERIVSGKVTRIADFGAFVELEPGVEGLVHISHLAWRRVGSVNEVLKVGDEKEFQVLEVDQKRKRVSLSLKALEQKPESVKKAEAEEEARPQRKPNLDLRGGTGGNSGAGGLFGNPSDFT